MRKMRVALRDCVSVLFKKTGSELIVVSFLFDSSRIVATYELSSLTFSCLKWFNGERTIEDIAQDSGVPVSELEEIVRYLLDENIVELLDGDRFLVPEYFERYRRQINFFSSFETPTHSRISFQDLLQAAHVLILGLGGIGTWIAEALGRVGVGHLTLIDPDRIELSNLCRQAFFQEGDVNKYKVDVVRDRLQQLSAGIEIVSVCQMIRSVEGLAESVSNATLVINCSDYPDVDTTNDIVSRACFVRKVPHILCGGYDGHLSYPGQTVIPGESACWRCYSESGEYEQSLNGFSHLQVTRASIEGGTIAPIAAITANFHALEAIRVLTGFSEPLMKNARAELDFLSFQISRIPIERRQDCSLCGSVAEEKTS